MSRENLLDEVQEGEIRPSTPAYFFWMKFLENEQTELQSEFQWRIMSDDGFIDWDFLPNQKGIAARLSKSEQYKRALDCVRRAIEGLSDCTNVNLAYIIERIRFLTYLKELTNLILVKRKKDIYHHDNLKNRIVESFSTKKRLRRHKEVYEIWIEISGAITRTLEVLADEKRERERAAEMQQTHVNNRRISQETNDDNAKKHDNCCVIS